MNSQQLGLAITRSPVYFFAFSCFPFPEIQKEKKI